ncbi:MAG: amidohydrolase [Bacteroidota bacterium]
MATALKVSTIQTKLDWENINQNLSQLTPKVTMLSGCTDLIVLPEMFTTGFSMKPTKLAEQPIGKTLNWLREQAKHTQAAITGSYIIKESNNYYNRLVWMNPDGTFHTYDKKHLFSLSEEPNQYTAGTKKLIVSYKGWKICPLICYDLRFPVWSRNVENYDLLLYVANWPEKRAHHWRSLLMARAIENQTYTVGVNRVGNDGNNAYHSGDTSIIDYAGKILAHTAHVENTTTLALNLEEQQSFRQQFQFLADKDEFTLP